MQAQEEDPVWGLGVRRKEEEVTKLGEFEALTGHLSGNVRCIRTLAMALFFFMSFLGDFFS